MSEDGYPEIRNWSNGLAAVDEFLKRTSTEGRARVSAAQRRLDVRIGHLLGEAKHGGDRRSDQVTREVLDREDDGLTPDLHNVA